MIISTAHWAMKKAVNKGYQQFIDGQDDVKSAQMRRLTDILTSVAKVNTDINPTWDWHAFKAHCALTEYEEWADKINAQRESGQPTLTSAKLMRYQPTSGSTSQFKLIPYTDMFLKELDNAIMPWFGSLYTQYPQLNKGKQYWSLSWLPESRRELMKGDVNDDSKLLSWGKRLLSLLTQTVPQGVTTASTIDDSVFATLAYLVADKSLALISVWSPTFALNMLDNLEEMALRQELAQVLTTGNWGKRAQSLQTLKTPRSAYAAEVLTHWQTGTALTEQETLTAQQQNYQRLWPNLVLISSWDTAMSAYWAQQLQDKFPSVAFQGKGLWMTEGVVTIPWGDTFILSYQSHFYEFECTETGEIHPSWDLKAGQVVTPIITTGSGLLRYKTSDLVEVTGFVKTVPTFKFLGRTSGVDLVGEKLSPAVAQLVLDEISAKHPDVLPVSLLALDMLQSNDKNTPYYLLLLKSEKLLSVTEMDAMKAEAEALLKKNFHYELARDLGQLAELKVYCAADAKQHYIDLCLANDMVEGDIKFEPLKYCANDTLINYMNTNAR